MATHSYEYNGKVYEFILSMKAKDTIEKAQRERQALALGNPNIAKLAVGARNKEELDDDQVTDLLPHMAELLPLMDGAADLSPLEIGFIVLSTYPPYREEVTREFFNGLVDDMDVTRGAEATFEFFTEVQDEVFTALARMQKMQAAKEESRNNLTQFLAAK